MGLRASDSSGSSFDDYAVRTRLFVLSPELGSATTVYPREANVRRIHKSKWAVRLPDRVAKLRRDHPVNQGDRAVNRPDRRPAVYSFLVGSAIGAVVQVLWPLHCQPGTDLLCIPPFGATALTMCGLLGAFVVALLGFGAMAVPTFILLNGIAYGVIGGAAWRLFVRRTAARRVSRGCCPACGYDVRSGGQTTCPECGTVVFDRSR